MIGYSREVYLALFESYAGALWPAPLVALALGALALWCAWGRGRARSRIAGAVLAAFWGLTGALFYFGPFWDLSFWAPVPGALFIAEAALIAWVLAVRGAARIEMGPGPAGKAGLALALLAFPLYPLISLALGRTASELEPFGLAPAPVLIFTFALLAMARPRAPRVLMVIPLALAALTGVLGFELGIYEDFAVVIAAGVGVWVWRRATRR